ncbi:MAG: methionine--tRNA ligase [bacterium]|nr:methionine--tRNA ligase [bacterium]
MSDFFVTTAIPYVNGRPHIGHALELVQTDVLARYRRQMGDAVRFQTGTDDNALKNVHSAMQAGMPTREYVGQVAERFASLREPLELSFDDFIKTSSDPRHRPGVERLWRACAATGDLYEREYEGLYCVGCEQFYTEAELEGGACPEHGASIELVRERNWFFHLRRYQDRLAEVIRSGELRIEPEHRRNEVLGFIEGGLEDFSISRSLERAHGWGIPVPGDSGQVIYVWWDALANYITTLDYGGDGCAYRRWWCDSAARVHVIGKGILRFHAVYWPAMLLSAGEPLPTNIHVHEYLTAGSFKIGKSAGNTTDPNELVVRYGKDPLRWWFLREVGRIGDTDFTIDRLVQRANEDLANNIGNLVNRTVSMIHRYLDGTVPCGTGDDPRARALIEARVAAEPDIRAAIDRFDFRTAVAAILRIADEGNRYIMATRPWELARAVDRGEQRQDLLESVLGELLTTCRAIGTHLRPFLPSAAERISVQCGEGLDRLPEPAPVFPKVDAGDGGRVTVSRSR